MDKEKKEIRKQCKLAHRYLHVQNPFGVIFVTLFDKDDKAFFEFQYAIYFPTREKLWVLKLLDEIDERSKNKR